MGNLIIVDFSMAVFNKNFLIYCFVTSWSFILQPQTGDPPVLASI